MFILSDMKFTNCPTNCTFIGFTCSCLCFISDFFFWRGAAYWMVCLLYHSSLPPTDSCAHCLEKCLLLCQPPLAFNLKKKKSLHSESHLIKCTHYRLFSWYGYVLFYSIQSVLTLLSNYIIAMSAEQVMMLDVPSKPSGSYYEYLALHSFCLFLLQQMGKFQRARILPWLQVFCTTCKAQSFNIQTSFGCCWNPVWTAI